MRKLTTKTALILFAVVLLPLIAVCSGKASASILDSINPLRPLANHMDAWLENTAIGAVGQVASRLLIGCTVEDLTKDDTTVAAANCINSGGNSNPSVIRTINGTPDSSTPQPSSKYPSLLGLSTDMLYGSTTQVDAYPVNMAVYWKDLQKDSLISPQSTYAAPTDIAAMVPDDIGLKLWKDMRNIAYLLFFIALVAIGFMVMFRYKINPQTTMTVQAALPKIVIVLLLVTFSWPIGSLALGLMVKLCEVAWGLGGNVLSPSNGLAVQLLASTIELDKKVIGTASVGMAFFMVVFLIGVILAIILAVISVIISIITRTLRIVAMTIFAPLQLTLGVLPGKESAITDWFKALLANMLAVPAIILMATIGIRIFVLGAQNNIDTLKTLTGTNATLIGQLVSFIMGFWFVWNARKAPSWIEGALGVGGGWVPGQKPKPTGGKK